MKYWEFGTENEKTLLLLHGFCTNWKISFQPLIEIAKKEFHVIAVAEDGFNPDEPEVDAVSVIEEARKVTEYIVEKFDGKIDIIYGASLGCMIMTEILLDTRITVHTAIADGFTIINYPAFKHDIFKRMLAGTIASTESFIFRHELFKKLLAKALGHNKPEELDKMLYTNVSKTTLYNMEYSLMPYRYKYEAFALSDSYIWHGENEKTSVKKVKKLLKQGYKFQHKIFPDCGHGSLLLQPERLLNEIKMAYASENVVEKC